MAFSDDNGGFAFSCNDGKMCIGASTWNTRLSQLGKVSGPVRILTGELNDVEYLGRILGKRPHDIFIIAHTSARKEAELLKKQFPLIRIALHEKNNSNVVLVAPATTWVSSANFGKSKLNESTVGLHSVEVHDRTVETVFNIMWNQARELL